MKDSLLTYEEVKHRLDLCNEMACVLIKNTRPWWNPEGWLYWGLQKAFKTKYNHSAVFFYCGSIPVMVCQAIGKGVIFEDFNQWWLRENRIIKELSKRSIKATTVLETYNKKYDYWKYARGIFIEQNRHLREKITERTRAPFYCHEMFPYFMEEKYGPWHPNRLISTFENEF